uniref:Uncharacterized protein n=1 Tax=Acidithiobacillus sulfuriphilus TaxID=1867749 RepID=A0A3M8QNH0_9PROT|nr:hypothetical protein EC580_14090 [Acidithiobacillus sulfuriphilus]
MALQFRQRPVHDHPDGTQRMILRDLLFRGEVAEQPLRLHLRTAHPIGLPPRIYGHYTRDFFSSLLNWQTLVA